MRRRAFITLLGGRGAPGPAPTKYALVVNLETANNENDGNKKFAGLLMHPLVEIAKSRRPQNRTE